MYISSVRIRAVKDRLMDYLIRLCNDIFYDWSLYRILYAAMVVHSGEYPIPSERKVKVIPHSWLVGTLHYIARLYMQHDMWGTKLRQIQKDFNEKFFNLSGNSIFEIHN